MYFLQSPHYHLELPALMPEANLVDNYCRNPTGATDERAWCYTQDSNLIWEYVSSKRPVVYEASVLYPLIAHFDMDL